MLSIFGVARNQVWYKQPLLYNFNIPIPNRSANLFGRVFLKENQYLQKMISVWSCDHSYRKYPSVILLNSFLPPKSEWSDQFAKPLKVKFLIAIISTTTLTILKYIEKDLQQILKTVLKA